MQRKGAAGLTTVLGVAAVVVTVGFLFWLYQRASTLDQRVEPALEDTAAEEGLPPLSLEELAAQPGEAVGSRAAVEQVGVATRLGRGAFAMRLSETRAYPVLLHSDLIERDVELYGGDVVSVWGRVYIFNDSIRGAWVEAGAVDEGQVDAVPESASFLLADSLVIQ